MKNALKLTLAVALVMSCTSLFAQKFGRINMQELVMAMPEAKTMQTNLEVFGKDLNNNIETIMVERNTKMQEYQKNLSTYSEATKQFKEKEINDIGMRLQEYQETARQDYEKKYNELLEPIVTKAKAAIAKVAKVGGYIGVFDTTVGSLAYFDETAMTDLLPTVKKDLGIQ